MRSSYFLHFEVVFGMGETDGCVLQSSMEEGRQGDHKSSLLQKLLSE